MTRKDVNRLKYTIAFVAEFAQRYELSERQAYNYLSRFKGLVHLSDFYDVLHTLSFEDAIESISVVCQNNGGKLQYNNV